MSWNDFNFNFLEDFLLWNSPPFSHFLFTFTQIHPKC